MEHFSKGQIVHRLKRRANEVAHECRKEGIRCHIRKMADGYRVDREK